MPNDIAPRLRQGPELPRDPCMKTVARPSSFLALAGLVACLSVAASTLLPAGPTPTRHLTLHHDRLGPVEVLSPPRDPDAFVVLLSGVEGITPALQGASERLVRRGAAVALLSSPRLLATLDAGTRTGCHYALGLFEEFSQAAQRNLGVTTYRRPVIVGSGLGGTLAFLSDLQAPANTIAGAVSLGFDPAFRPRLPFCGTTPIPAADGTVSYRPPGRLPGHWIAIPDGRGDAALAGLAATGSAGELRPAGGHGLRTATEAALDIARLDGGGAQDMPVEEVPARDADTLVVFYSGDGGWRDIDKRISDYLSRNGVAVIGIDSLRYFWRRKSPVQIGADLDRLIARYKQRWHARRVALVGYSMGAGVLPFAWSNLPAGTRETVKLIALLSLDPKASFEISASGYLGLDSESDVGIEPAVLTMPLDRVMCFYGSEERDPAQSGCLGAAMTGATLVERPGGHHFDGDYEPIARMILARLKAAPRNS